MEYVLQTKGLCKRYRGRSTALDGLEMNVPEGAIYGLVGRNGAGKTTLLRLVCGLQEATSGEFTLYGTKSTDRNICRARQRLGAVVEKPAMYPDMTAEENLRMQYMSLGLPSYKDIPELLSSVGLENTGRKRARNFSLGMRQRLGIAIALAGSPDLLILDEPVNGLDPQGIIETRELILRLNRERRMTVVISSHILDELSKLATHYGFIDKGKMIKEISAEELESSCRKCVRLNVSDTFRLVRVLDKLGLEYTILDSNNADIYGGVKTTELVEALAAERCEVISISEHNESLENYFMELVGGAER